MRCGVEHLRSDVENRPYTLMRSRFTFFASKAYQPKITYSPAAIVKEQVVRFDVAVGVSTLMHSLQDPSDFQHRFYNHFKGWVFSQLLLGRGG
ncbi:hypothetical protein D3C81_1980850 [compost metagenome]